MPFRDKGPGNRSGRNNSVDFHGKTFKNDTRASTTDPESRLFRKGKGKESKLCYMGHVLMENRNGLMVDTRFTLATGTAEREAAAEMVQDIPGTRRGTVGADKGYDTEEFVATLRSLATPHRARHGDTKRIFKDYKNQLSRKIQLVKSIRGSIKDP
ncbi:MAG: transposase [Desulfuromonadaceae bacterium]|nr:transposase [Desulfuromonadaceae bacterium]